MAYDSARKRTVLFGGYAGSSFFGDTWEWDGTAWIPQLVKVFPSARRYHAMAYDSARKRTVLFGGYDGSKVLGDTWEWDGKVWTQVTPAASPSVRYHHALAYDAARQRTVLFGSIWRSADTWEWDGKVWTQIKPTTSPTGRYAAMSYDSARQRTVLFSGYDASGRSGVPADTWEWDGKVWTQIKPATSPKGRYSHSLVYDSARQRTVLFGGSSLADTWEWDGKAWTQIKPVAWPRGRHFSAMAYDAARQRTVLFGGSDILIRDETWEYHDPGSVAKFDPFGVSCGPTLTAATNSRPIIGTTFTMVTRNLPSTATAALMSAGVSNMWIYSFPLPLNLDFMGMKGCFLHHSFDATWVFPVTSGTGSFSVSIPNNPAYLGLRLYFQSAASGVTSNGGEVYIGDK
jgi:hypothetical protein